MQGSNANNCLDSDVWLENGLEGEYGSHILHVSSNLREKVCAFCDQRKPASLEELAFSVVLENADLFKTFDSALCHLPHRICWLIGRALNANLLSQAWKLVGFVSEYGETRASWFDVDESKTKFLSRFRLNCEVHQKLKPYLASRSAGIDEILDYLSNFNSTYEDFWSKMTSAVTKLKAETESEDLAHLTNIVCADENNVVLVKIKELKENPIDGYEYESMKELQYLSKTFACPVVFRPTVIGILDLQSDEIPHLLDDLDPEAISDVHLGKSPAWSVEDIDELGRVLSACNNLSSIYLRHDFNIDEVVEGMGAAVSRLLSHHLLLRKLELIGLNLAGTFSSYPLPSVENLLLAGCTLTDEDWNFMANRSDLALKSLIVLSHFDDIHFSSLSSVIQNQAKSLKTLGIDYPTARVSEICELLRIMAKLNKLQMFCLMCPEELDFDGIERITVDLMAIHSIRRFFIINPPDSERSEIEEEMSRVDDLMKKLCKTNRRPPISLGMIIPTVD